MSFERIEIEKAQDLIANRNAQVIDVRDPDSYEAGHIENAEHVNDNNIADFMEQPDFNRPLIVCCYHGNMSQGAADYFNEQGFKETYSLDGGYEGWKEHFA